MCEKKAKGITKIVRFTVIFIKNKHTQNVYVCMCVCSARSGLGLTDLSSSDLSQAYQTGIITNYGFGGIVVTVNKVQCGVLDSNGNIITESDETDSLIVITTATL